jgi:hypothetical protein
MQTSSGRERRANCSHSSWCGPLTLNHIMVDRGRRGERSVINISGTLSRSGIRRSFPNVSLSGLLYTWVFCFQGLPKFIHSSFFLQCLKSYQVRLIYSDRPSYVIGSFKWHRCRESIRLLKLCPSPLRCPSPQITFVTPHYYDLASLTSDQWDDKDMAKLWGNVALSAVVDWERDTTPLWCLSTRRFHWQHTVAQSSVDSQFLIVFFIACIAILVGCRLHHALGLEMSTTLDRSIHCCS